MSDVENNSQEENNDENNAENNAENKEEGKKSSNKALTIVIVIVVLLGLGILGLVLLTMAGFIFLGESSPILPFIYTVI